MCVSSFIRPADGAIHHHVKFHFSPWVLKFFKAEITYADEVTVEVLKSLILLYLILKTLQIYQASKWALKKSLFPLTWIDMFVTKQWSQTCVILSLRHLPELSKWTSNIKIHTCVLEKKRYINGFHVGLLGLAVKPMGLFWCGPVCSHPFMCRLDLLSTQTNWQAVFICSNEKTKSKIPDQFWRSKPRCKNQLVLQSLKICI